MQKSQAKTNPYCSFKNDRERRIALISRDARLILFAFMAAVTGAPQAAAVLQWLIKQ